MSQFRRPVSCVFAGFLMVTSAHHVLAQQPSGTPPYVPGELLVGLASETDREALINRLDATRRGLRAAGEAPARLTATRTGPSELKLTVEFPPNVLNNPGAELEHLQEIARQLKASNPNVEYAHPNWIVNIKPPLDEAPSDGGTNLPSDVRTNLEKIGPQLAAPVPNDPLFQIGLHWDYLPPPTGMNAVGAWQIERGSRDIVVAVLDSGFVFDQPDAVGSGNVTRGYNFLSLNICTGRRVNRTPDATDPGDACPEKGKKESSWHGTHVAGTIGAIGSNNGRGMTGVAWNVTVVPVRVLGPGGGTAEDVVAGIRWAAGLPVPGVRRNERRADVINMSLGGFGRCTPDQNGAYIRAIQEARRAGSVVVVAAGNGQWVDQNGGLCKPGSSPGCKDRPIDFRNESPVSCPGVISVAASDKRGFLAYYSNYGPVTITAPGGDGRMTQEFMINGEKRKLALGVWSAVHSVFGAMQGTSQATPHVSGAIALALAKNPSWRGQPDLIERKVRASAVQPPQGACPQGCGPGLLDAVRLLNQR